MPKRGIATGLALLLGLCLAFAAGEVLVRACGRGPWYKERIAANEPVLHEPDPVLGWKSKPGHFVIPPYVPGGDPIEETILERGERRTGTAPIRDDLPSLVLVGGSFTEGWAVSDDETDAWKLQAALPGIQVLDFGTSAYGTYQSLLMLERQLPRLTAPRFVLYGFIEDHEVRNVAPHYWMGILAALSHRGHVDVPYVTLDGHGGLVRHPPERYLALPFHEYSALIATVEAGYMKFKTRGRLAQKTPVTEELLREMDRRSTEAGATFVTVALYADQATRDHYRGFLERSGIRYVDCHHEMTEDLKVPGEGHPNGKLHAIWARCILSALASDFEPYRAVPGTKTPAHEASTAAP
jgi:hypothetical protein